MAGSQSPMYQAFVEVVPEASGFSGALTGQVTAAGAAAGAAGGKLAAGGFMAGFGKAVPILGAALASIGLADVFGEAIADAGDLQQNVGAVRDVFEDASSSVEKFADKAAKTIGLSANDALVGARNFGIFGRAAGLIGEDLSTFSTDLLTLSADLAAFGNTSPEQAVTAISAALRGEMEPIRQYGVILDDAALRAKALELGIYDGNGALTAQQKVLAANAAIWGQTSIQQGKAAEDAKTLTGRQAQLTASWENLSAKLGTAFLPIAEQVVEWMISDMIPALEDFSEWLNKPETQEGITQLGTAMKEFGSFVHDYFIVPISGAIGSVSGLVGYLNGTLSFDEFKEKMLALPGFFGEVARAGNDLGTTIGRTLGDMVRAVGQFATDVGIKINEAVAWFVSLPGRIGSVVGNMGAVLFNSGRSLIQGFLGGITSMWTDITKTIGGVMSYVAGFFPNSPAKHGPFSGSGWTKLGRSGEAIGKQFASGIEAQYKSIQLATQGLTGAAVPAGAAGASVQMDIHPAPGMSEEVIGRIAAEKVAFELRRA